MAPAYAGQSHSRLGYGLPTSGYGKIVRISGSLPEVRSPKSVAETSIGENAIALLAYGRGLGREARCVAQGEWRGRFGSPMVLPKS